jgi:hypothetical protein
MDSIRVRNHLVNFVISHIKCNFMSIVRQVIHSKIFYYPLFYYRGTVVKQKNMTEGYKWI